MNVFILLPLTLSIYFVVASCQNTECPANAHFEYCPNKCLENNCNELRKHLFGCERDPKCIPGCVCNKHYWRVELRIPGTKILDGNPKCVNVDECPPLDCSYNNATYSSCPPHCYEYYSCQSLYEDVDCPVEDDPECRPNCICEEGFLRNDVNDCVSKHKCCPWGETYDECPILCLENRCDKIEKNIDTCPANSSSVVCTPGCICSSSIYRNDEGKCVQPRDCPPVDCSHINGVFDPCTNPCINYKCSSLYIMQACTASASSICYPKCVCGKGFLANDDGICIPEEKCVGFCPDPKTLYNVCGEICERTCENKDAVCPVENCPGPGKCLCKDEFVKHPDGRCVLPDDCPPVKCKNPLTAWNKCGKSCEVTCSNRKNPPDCNHNNCQGPGACICKQGYVRNGDGNCILPKNCQAQKPKSLSISVSCENNFAFNELNSVVFDSNTKLTKEIDIKSCMMKCLGDLNENASNRSECSMENLRKCVKSCIYKLVPEIQRMNMKKLKASFKRHSNKSCQY